MKEQGFSESKEMFLFPELSPTAISFKSTPSILLFISKLCLFQLGSFFLFYFIFCCHQATSLTLCFLGLQFAGTQPIGTFTG